jgi:hypothetical protein
MESTKRHSKRSFVSGIDPRLSATAAAAMMSLNQTTQFHLAAATEMRSGGRASSGQHPSPTPPTTASAVPPTSSTGVPTTALGFPYPHQPLAPAPAPTCSIPLLSGTNTSTSALHPYLSSASHPSYALMAPSSGGASGAAGPLQSPSFFNLAASPTSVFASSLVYPHIYAPSTHAAAAAAALAHPDSRHPGAASFAPSSELRHTLEVVGSSSSRGIEETASPAPGGQASATQTSSSHLLQSQHETEARDRSHDNAVTKKETTTHQSPSPQERSRDSPEQNQRSNTDATQVWRPY